ncbi:hypothetical protein [Geodermatophilus marinus]|uniref:hypothetical protein n=1 Tax=Geodermatophilus sp. LHW52908 TaxID=2303986 RepID=UPI000E3C9306|nr:hypothetical protein [Geodermatophilus sp. LHW52908]RFU21166.1 hypothetical protein D0Z06_12295 [Geodermatophilus sp. LHW52908]
MDRRRALVVLLAATGLVLAPAATASAAPAPPPPGGCQAFGAHVASLATSLGGDFGATASSAATSGPLAFPTIVVGPEQEEFCD